MKKLSILIVMMIAFLAACSTPGDIKPPEENSSGSIEWKSKRTPTKVTINKDYGFEFVGSKSLRRGDKIYDYSVFQDQGGRIIYIIDWKHKSWQYPQGADILTPHQEDGLLEYMPHQFVIWTGISKFSYDVLTDMGVDVPECKVALNDGRLNQRNRNEAVFVVFVVPWSCDREGYMEILDQYHDVVFIW
jgi:hypothetical protein